MAPEGCRKGKGKARAKMLTSVINQRLLLDWDRIKGCISGHIRGLIRIYNVCSIKDERAWDLFYEIIFLDPVTTRHCSHFQLMWPPRRSRSSPFPEWWAAFHSYMGQMFDKTRNHMNNWRWDNPCAVGDQVDLPDRQATNSAKFQRTSEGFSWYGSDDPWAKIELPSCRQYKPGDFLSVRPLNWDEIIDEDDDDEHWADPRAPSGGRGNPGDDNDNDDGVGEEETQGGGKRTAKRMGSKDGNRMGKGKRKAMEEGMGKGTGHGKGKGSAKQTSGGDDISRAVALQLQKEIYEAD